jgi:hypothetical protein
MGINHPLGGVTDLNLPFARSQPVRAAPESHRGLGHVRGQAGVRAGVDHLPMHTFPRTVARYGGDRSVKSFTCQEQFRAMAFAQLTYRDRDLSVGAGVEALPYGLSRARPTLDARRRQRDQRLAHLRRFRPAADRSCAQALCRHGPRTRSDEQRLCVDSTTIDLCLSVFPWAHFRTTKSATRRLHTSCRRDRTTRVSVPIHPWPGPRHWSGSRVPKDYRGRVDRPGRRFPGR